MRVRALLCAAVLAAAPVAATELSYAEANALSDRDEASLSPAQMEALVSAHGQALGEAIPACVDRDNPPARITSAVILELDAAGRVMRTWHGDETPMTLCLERELRSKQFGSPPRAPFYTGMSLNIDVTVEG